MSLLDPTQPARETILGEKRNVLCMQTAYIRQRRAGRYLERVVTSHVPLESPIVRLPSEVFRAEEWGPKENLDHAEGEVVKPYLLKSTGEVKLCKPILAMRNPGYVKKTCNNFKWKVRANARYAKIFLTLTYARNMTDTVRLYEDFRRFWQKVKRNYHNKFFGYLVAFEPQERGAWHAHVILLSRRPGKIFVPNRRFHKMWGHGFTKTKSANGINNIAEYLTSYLVNVKNGEHTKKGARLHLYPANFQFLRNSRNIDRPEDSGWWGDDATVIPGLDEYELCYDYYNEYEWADRNVCQRRMLFTSIAVPA